MVNPADQGPRAPFPDLLKALPQWTTHTNRRPATAPNAWAKGKTYEALEKEENIGLLLSPYDDVAVIDVDFPGTKAQKRQYAQLVQESGFTPDKWHTAAFYEWLNANTGVIAQLAHTEFAHLLTSTYVELSPSGLGLHIFLRVQDKEQVQAAFRKSTNKGFAGQISLQNAFITVTRIPLQGCATEIKQVSVYDFPTTFGFTKEVVVKKDVEETLSRYSNASSRDIAKALQIVPCSSDNKKVHENWHALTGKKYEHYEFWLIIGMALHQYGQSTKQSALAYSMWLDWSRQDEENFTGEESIEKKWKSFSLTENSITINTLLAIAARVEFEYPKPIYKDGKKTMYPETCEYANFKYLMDYYGIHLWEDDLFFLSGEDKEVMEKYFGKQPPVMHKYYGPYTQKELEAFTMVFCQDKNWKKLSSTSTLAQAWISCEAKKLDLFKEWLDTPFDELPEGLKKVNLGTEIVDARNFDANSTPEYLFACMNTQHRSEEDRELYFSMFKKLLMQMIKFREPQVLDLPFVDNGGMLILSGAENTYKSTFCKLLVPRMLDEVRKEINSPLTGDKAIRDFLRYFATKTIIQVDEFESVMDINSSFFKNLLSGNDPSFVEIFGTKETKKERRAVVIGTTNARQLVLSEEGTRRLWFIPVGKMDTTSALKVNLHKLYNDLRREFKDQFSRGIMPWLLSQEEIDQLNLRNQGFSSTCDLDLILEEVFPTDGESMPEDYLEGVDATRYTGEKLMKSKQVRDILTIRGYSGVKPTALEHALERHCGKWTETVFADKEAKGKPYILRKGRLCQTWIDSKQRYNTVRWVMPPISDA